MSLFIIKWTCFLGSVTFLKNNFEKNIIRFLPIQSQFLSGFASYGREILVENSWPHEEWWWTSGEWNESKVFLVSIFHGVIIYRRKVSSVPRTWNLKLQPCNGSQMPDSTWILSEISRYGNIYKSHFQIQHKLMIKQ